jgi:hypothetical protein
MKGTIALCIIGAVVAAGIDVVIITKYGIDPLRHWPFFWSGAFLVFAFISKSVWRSRQAAPAAIRTP